jgi:ABC-type nitrate/sulfonate/bicarbonate transport system permease component
LQKNRRLNYQAERLFAAAALASLSGLLFFAIVCLIERRFRKINPA